ncbi:hypothetical protein [Enterococcus casseliflavus]|uniref:hypothetical protein n=1 Tax=Enterococcus casseliflavus TaxID=37734 RepID=UPI001F4F4E58|nr:hypothetical protein [Enterococcus casseliflavus]
MTDQFNKRTVFNQIIDERNEGIDPCKNLKGHAEEDQDGRIKSTESFLKTLGTIEDFTYCIVDKYRNTILKSYELYENKYNDVTDDSLCIEIWSNGTYLVTNETLNYYCKSEADLQLLKELFHKTSFCVDVTELNRNGHKATVNVEAIAKNLKELEQLIKEYRVCNSNYLKDKVVEIVGDDGNIYLDRKIIDKKR